MFCHEAWSKSATTESGALLKEHNSPAPGLFWLASRTPLRPRHLKNRMPRSRLPRAVLFAQPGFSVSSRHSLLSGAILHDDHPLPSSHSPASAGLTTSDAPAHVCLALQCAPFSTTIHLRYLPPAPLFFPSPPTSTTHNPPRPGASTCPDGLKLLTHKCLSGFRPTKILAAASRSKNP